MSFIAHYTDSMTLTPQQLENLKSDYAWQIVDGMDLKTLCQWAAEQIEANMKDYDETDLQEEISDMMGEDVWEDMKKDAIG